MAPIVFFPSLLEAEQMPALISGSNFSLSVVARRSRAATPQVQMRPFGGKKNKTMQISKALHRTRVHQGIQNPSGDFCFSVVVVVHINRFVHLDPDKHLSHKSPQSICKKSSSCAGASLPHLFVRRLTALFLHVRTHARTHNAFLLIRVGKCQK